MISNLVYLSESSQQQLVSKQSVLISPNGKRLILTRGDQEISTEMSFELGFEPSQAVLCRQGKCLDGPPPCSLAST